MSTRFWIGIAAAVVSASPILAGQSEIHACVHKNTGALRIVSSAASCNSNNETPLTWSKSGFQETGLFYLYESTDCTGQAYVEYNDRIPEWGGSSLGGGGSLTIYYAAQPIVRRTIQSSRSVFSSGPAQPCLGPLNFAGVPVGIPQTATLTASPPFRLVD